MADTETVIQGTTATDAENQARTFTQAELDEIVKSRIAKEKAKYADYETLQAKASKLDEIEETNKTELQKATEKANVLQAQIDAMNKANDVRTVREKVAKDTGVPASLLTAENEEDCMEQAKNLLAFKNENISYPQVKDGGEINVTSKKSDVDLFSEWFKASLN